MVTVYSVTDVDLGMRYVQFALGSDAGMGICGTPHRANIIYSEHDLGQPGCGEGSGRGGGREGPGEGVGGRELYYFKNTLQVSIL